MPHETAHVFTIGHSTHSWERFVALLRSANVTAVADVRSSPYSRHCPHFNRDELRDELRREGISYVFLGNELGGRPRERRLYRDGIADYEKMARSSGFVQGIDRVIEGAGRLRVALLCSEQDPLDCHRCLLIGRALAERGVAVSHMLSDGAIASHGAMEDWLLDICGRAGPDLFASRAERLAMAYRERARKVAFAEWQSDPSSQIAAE